MFNKPTSLKWNEIDHPYFFGFFLTKWIEEEKMTEEEKVKNPDFKTTKGYLKKFEYKEAWANFWRYTDEENRKKFLALPNFDPKVFYDITGINIVDEASDVELTTKTKCAHKKNTGNFCPDCGIKL